MPERISSCLSQKRTNDYEDTNAHYYFQIHEIKIKT